VEDTGKDLKLQSELSELRQMHSVASINHNHHLQPQPLDPATTTTTTIIITTSITSITTTTTTITTTNSTITNTNSTITNTNTTITTTTTVYCRQRQRGDNNSNNSQDDDGGGGGDDGKAMVKWVRTGRGQRRCAPHPLFLSLTPTQTSPQA
jgi:hypothetical protein